MEFSRAEQEFQILDNKNKRFLAKSAYLRVMAAENSSQE